MKLLLILLSILILSCTPKWMHLKTVEGQVELARESWIAPVRLKGLPCKIVIYSNTSSSKLKATLHIMEHDGWKYHGSKKITSEYLKFDPKLSKVVF